jgi:hypothetical protein
VVSVAIVVVSVVMLVFSAAFVVFCVVVELTEIYIFFKPQKINCYLINFPTLVSSNCQFLCPDKVEGVCLYL